MGRKKIAIKEIFEKRQRTITLNKRKKGLIKKAMEISLLTGVKINLLLVDPKENMTMRYLSHPRVEDTPGNQ